MHHCLQISEVLRAIFRSFQPYQGNFTLGDLSAAARTCKGFYEPASDVLWENLDDLTPLVKCLPPNLWYEEEEGGGSNLWSVYLVRELDFSEWEIVNKHAHRVRVLEPGNARWSAGFQRRYRLSAEALNQFTVWLWSRGWEMDHSRIFLPNLVRLHWVCSLNGDKSVNCIPLLGGQRLEDLTISGDSVPPSSNHAIEAMIHTLSLIPQSSPNLRRFTIKLFYQLAWNIIAGPVSSLLQSLPRLEELDSCFAFMDDAYAHLAHLPTLKIFRGMIPPLRNHPVLVTPSDAPIFPSLTELDLDAMELGSCITLVSCMGSTALEKLCSATNVPGLVTAADVKDLFVALRRQSSLKKLSIIRRKFSSEANIAIHEGPEHTLFSHDIFPLLELQNLTELVIDIDAPFDIDDDCLRAMAEAWPKLQVLSAYSPAPIGRRPKTTLRGLLFLAEHCPLLKKLDINLDTHLVDDDIREASKNLRPRKHNLQNLNVYFWSSLGNPAQVAEFLIGLFPEVTVNANPVCERDGNEKMIIEWGAFQAFLKGFARKDADAGRW